MMTSYQQWKMLHESTINLGLGNRSAIGGVVGATGASDWASKKEALRRYMLGEDEESPDDDEDEKSLPKPEDDDDDVEGDHDHDDDGDEDDDDAGFGKKPVDKKPLFDKGDMGHDDDMDKPHDDLGHDDDDMGHDDGMGDDLDHDADDMGHDDDMDKPHDDLGHDDDMGHDDDLDGDMDHDDMEIDHMDGDEVGEPKAHGDVCSKCGHHEADTNAKFCKMCGNALTMSKYMKKFMSKGKICPVCGRPNCKEHGEIKPKHHHNLKVVVRKEARDFVNSLKGQMGKTGQVYSDGIAGKKPGPGQVGFAPSGRIGGF